MQSTSAQWIWHAGPAEPNTWLRCRKTFHLDEVPANAIVRIAVDSKYWLTVSGRLVIREGGLKRGPTPRDTYCDVVDLSPHLNTGENTIEVLVWYWGVDGSSHLSSGQGGLWFDSAFVVSDTTWQVGRHPGFLPSTIKAFGEKTVLSEWNIYFDARRQDQSWSAPITFGQPPCEPWGALIDRPIPFWRDSELRAYDAVETTESPDGGQVIRCKLPANLQVYPYFRIAAPAGLKATVQIERDWKTTEYTTRDGEQEFEVPAWGNGHDVTYTFPPGVRVIELRYRETGYDTDFAGSFECDDEALNLLWKKSARSTYVNMRDTYMDCPDRERSQWPNDAVPMMEQTFYAFDPKSHALSRKFIREFIDWRTPDGILWGAVPTGRWRGSYREHAAITLATICGMSTYYDYTGDLETVRYAYPHVRDYLLNHWQVDPTELVQHRGPDKVEWGPGTQNWYDWGDHQDWRLMDNAWLALALQSAAKMGHAVGESTDELEQGAHRITSRFNEIFWRGDHYASPDYQGRPDPRGAALAWMAGVVPLEQHDHIADLLLRSDHASIYMEKFVVSALLSMGRTDEAIARIKRRYATEITSDYSTLPENFGERSNHGWGGWPLTLLARQVAGVRPLEPGFAKVAIGPKLGSLKSLKLVVPTVAGPLSFEMKQSDQFEITLKTPVPADIKLPDGFKLIRSVPAGDWSFIGTRSSG